MPVYKASILNREINLNYEYDQKEKLEKAVDVLNKKLKSFDNKDGKISDNKLLSLIAIKLQAEIFDITSKNQVDINEEKNIADLKKNNIYNKDKLHSVSEENKLLKEENEFINKEIDQLHNQINIIIKVLKTDD